jgi:putative hydrolase of the HAD superfamily
MSAEYQPQEWVPPDVIDTLRALSEAGLRLAVVSNRNQPCKDELARLGLLEYLEFSLTSGEVSSWKPDPTIFKFALQRMELQPQAAVYVGDNYYADVVGANRAGLQPILIDPDGLFPEAECPVISTIGDLCGFLA